MGIINLTPDSFYPGSRLSDPKSILDRVEEMINEGAAIIDMGACSTRPGSIAPSGEEEKRRLFPALETVRKKFPDILISIDTWRSEIARDSVFTYRADIINDVSAGNMDSSMIETVAECNVPYVLMHMQGSPENMQKKPAYNDFLKDILEFFHKKTEQCKSAGIKDLIIDPGFGFGKTLEQNFSLLYHLREFGFFGYPILAGLSRKSMVFKPLNTDPDHSLNGTTVLHTLALQQGVHILRVHDVKEAAEAILLCGQNKKAAGFQKQDEVPGDSLFI